MTRNTNANATREEWSARKPWSEGVFNSLEQFVELGTASQIKKLVETEDAREFFNDIGGTPPEPFPSNAQVAYMVAYADNEVDTLEGEQHT